MGHTYGTTTDTMGITRTQKNGEEIKHIRKIPHIRNQ
jgi:hypothetical protein